MKRRSRRKRLTLDSVLKKELEDDEFRVHFTAELARNEIARLVVRVRKELRLTQVELAKRASTTQAVIGRLESGTDKRIPSLPLLSRIAAATGRRLTLSFQNRIK